MKETSFTEFIEHLCKRSSTYTEGSVIETLAFIDGYRLGNTTPISGRIFDQYVCIRKSFPSNYRWTYVVKTSAKDDNEAFKLIKEVINEFTQLR